jgi:host factor-I protein
MSKSSMNLQDSFLNQVRRDNAEVNILLTSGKSLRGTVKGFDNFTVVLNSRGSQHLIYKHAIAQVTSQRAAQGRRGEADATQGESEHTPEAPAENNRNDESSRGSKKDSFNAIDLSNVRLQQVSSPE